MKTCQQTVHTRLLGSIVSTSAWCLQGLRVGVQVIHGPCHFLSSNRPHSVHAYFDGQSVRVSVRCLQVLRVVGLLFICMSNFI